MIYILLSLLLDPSLTFPSSLSPSPSVFLRWLESIDLIRRQRLKKIVRKEKKLQEHVYISVLFDTCVCLKKDLALPLPVFFCLQFVIVFLRAYFSLIQKKN